MREITPAQRAAAHAELADDLRAGAMVDAKETGSLSRLVMAGGLAATLLTAPGIANGADNPLAAFAGPNVRETQRALITDGCNPASLEQMAALNRYLASHQPTEEQRATLERTLGLVAQTPLGSHLLHQAQLNDVQMAILPQDSIPGTAAAYMPAFNTIAVSDAYVHQAPTIVHELKHAENLHNRTGVLHLTGAAVARMGKATYVTQYLHEEANAHAAEIFTYGDLHRINATRAAEEYRTQALTPRTYDIIDAYNQVRGTEHSAALPYMTEQGLEALRKDQVYRDQAERNHDAATKCVTEGFAERRDDGTLDSGMINHQLREQRRAALLDKARANAESRRAPAAQANGHER